MTGPDHVANILEYVYSGKPLNIAIHGAVTPDGLGCTLAVDGGPEQVFDAPDGAVDYLTDLMGRHCPREMAARHARYIVLEIIHQTRFPIVMVEITFEEDNRHKPRQVRMNNKPHEPDQYIQNMAHIDKLMTTLGNLSSLPVILLAPESSEPILTLAERQQITPNEWIGKAIRNQLAADGWKEEDQCKD